MRGACQSFHGGWGSFLGSLPLRLLLYFIYRFVQCKMQKLPRKQQATLPLPPSPLRMCLQIPSPLSPCVSARGCRHYLFVLQNSVMVSTGGGDSPLLIPAGPWLLLVGPFSRGHGGVGLALLNLLLLGLFLIRQTLKKLLVVQPVADIEILLCCTVCPCTLQGRGGEAQFRLLWDRAQSPSWGGCRAGLPAGNQGCEQCPSDT